jgi:hypothetical protein
MRFVSPWLGLPLLLLTAAAVACEQSPTEPAPLCTYHVSPLQFSPCVRAGYEMTTTITTSAVCPWTASPTASWIVLTRGSSGTGSGIVGFTVADNYDAPRAGSVVLSWPTPGAVQTVQVAQAGCLYSVSPVAVSFTAAGGTGTVDVFQQTQPNECGGPLQNACLWTASADQAWITVTTSMPRSGDDTVRFVVSANPTSSLRTGTITVRDKAVRITQAPG